MNRVNSWANHLLREEERWTPTHKAPEGFRILRATVGPLSKSHVYNGKTLGTKTCFCLTHLLVSPNDHRPLAWPHSRFLLGTTQPFPLVGKR